MKDRANSMAVNTLKRNEVWYVDSRALNHMTSHEEWFSHLEKSKQSGVVKTGDDTLHLIKHVGDVPLSQDRHKGRLMNVLHVPTVIKNLVFVGQIVDQRIQVRFTHLVCFIDEEGR